MAAYSSDFFVLLLYFGNIQSKNEAAQLEVSIFQKSTNMEAKNFWPTKIESDGFCV